MPRKAGEHGIRQRNRKQRKRWGRIREKRRSLKK